MPAHRPLRLALAVAMTGLCVGTSAHAAWIQLVSPSCRIVSEVSESRTRAWALEFERFRNAIGQVLLIDDRRLEPVSVVLFASDRRFRPYKPFENGRPAEVAGYFLRSPGRNLIAVSVDGARDQSRERIFHETTHWYLSALDHPPPLWLNEGLADFFATFRPGKDRFTVGSSRSDWVLLLRSFPPEPFATLAAVQEGSLRYNGHDSDHTTHFYVQAWATTHFLLLGGDPRGLSGLRSYLQQDQPLLDAATQARIFARTPDEIDRELSGYLYRKQWRQYAFPFVRQVDPSTFKVSAASDVEVDLALGSLLIGAGRPEAATERIARAASAAPDDPRPLGLLGEIDFSAGRLDAALARFEGCFARGGESFLGHYLAVGAGLQKLERAPAADAGGLQAQITTHLLAALELNPRVRECYQLAAFLEAFASAPTPTEFKSRLEEGRRRFPDDPAVNLGLGFAALHRGDIPAARRCRASAPVDRLPAGSPLLPLRQRLDESLRRAAGPWK